VANHDGALRLGEGPERRAGSRKNARITRGRRRGERQADGPPVALVLDDHSARADEQISRARLGMEHYVLVCSG
jgi:hypothetical protein